jgi:hypothetical protein
MQVVGGGSAVGWVSETTHPKIHKTRSYAVHTAIIINSDARAHAQRELVTDIHSPSDSTAPDPLVLAYQGPQSTRVIAQALALRPKQHQCLIIDHAGTRTLTHFFGPSLTDSRLLRQFLDPCPTYPRCSTPELSGEPALGENPAHANPSSAHPLLVLGQPDRLPRMQEGRRQVLCRQPVHLGPAEPHRPTHLTRAPLSLLGCFLCFALCSYHYAGHVTCEVATHHHLGTKPRVPVQAERRNRTD